MPAIEVTSRAARRSAASLGPCSMRLDEARGRGPRQPGGSAARRSRAREGRAGEMPLASRRSPSPRRACRRRRGCRRAGPKRGPSSSRNATAATVRRGGPAARIASAASSASSVPSAPSKRPPSGGVSRCEPLQISGRPGRAEQTADELPPASNATSSPASRIHPATCSNARCSPWPRPRRFVPSAWPISNSVSRRARMRGARASAPGCVTAPSRAASGARPPRVAGWPRLRRPEGGRSRADRDSRPP